MHSHVVVVRDAHRPQEGGGGVGVLRVPGARRLVGVVAVLVTVLVLALVFGVLGAASTGAFTDHQANLPEAPVPLPSPRPAGW